MKSHAWSIERVDGGPAGVEEFWQCPDCGACGGLAVAKPPHWVYLAGPAMPLSDDCEIAELQVRAFLRGQEFKHRIKLPEKFYDPIDPIER